MFRAKLISVYHQKEEQTRLREARTAAKTEKQVREYISCMFGPEWAERAKVNGREVRIEDIKLFVGNNSDLSRTGPLGDFLLVLGPCPRCGAECWSQECYSTSDVGEQLADFQVSWIRHKCTGLGKFLRRLRSLSLI